MDADSQLVWVTFFRVNDSRTFSRIIKDVTAVMTEKEGEPRGYWYSFMGGGENDPDYMVSRTYPNYAALDVEEDGPFKMYMDVDATWSYIWEFNEELSN